MTITTYLVFIMRSPLSLYSFGWSVFSEVLDLLSANRGDSTVNWRSTLCTVWSPCTDWTAARGTGILRFPTGTCGSTCILRFPSGTWRSTFTTSTWRSMRKYIFLLCFIEQHRVVLHRKPGICDMHAEAFLWRTKHRGVNLH